MTIKKLDKPKKKRNQTLGYWQRKADALLQEIGRDMYQEKGCLVCGGDYSCLHHFYPKSQTTYLRYSWKNLIPICVKCHMAHHNEDPDIHASVIGIKGEEWYHDLKAERNKNRYVSAGYTYYRNIYDNLKITKPYKV